MNPRKSDVGGRCVFRAEIDFVMGSSRQPPVRGVAVGHDDGPDCRVLHDKRMEMGAVNIRDSLQAASPRVDAARDLYSSGKKHFADGTAALPTIGGIAPSSEGNARLVDLYKALQRSPVWIDHRTAEFVQKQPCGLVSNSELRLEL